MMIPTDLNSWVSLLSGIVACIGAFLTCKLYWQQYVNLLVAIFKNPFSPKADVTDWFGHGIVVGFAAGGLNALYWSVFLRIGYLSNDVELIAFLRYYGAYADFILKGGLAFASFCHLHAALYRLPYHERRHWSVWTIPWHPRKPFNCLKTLLLKAIRKI